MPKGFPFFAICLFALGVYLCVLGGLGMAGHHWTSGTIEVAFGIWDLYFGVWGLNKWAGYKEEE